MSFTVYEILVPTMIHGVVVLDDYIDHARAWENKNGLPPQSVLAERLAPDMLSFGEQFSVICDKVDVHIAKLKQAPLPELVPVSLSYESLKLRLAATRALLEKIEPNDIADAQSHTYELRPPIVRGWYGGDDYIRHLVIPDFFFHIAMVHAILRHIGVPVGKRDYLGHLTQQSGGDYS